MERKGNWVVRFIVVASLVLLALGLLFSAVMRSRNADGEGDAATVEKSVPVAVQLLVSTSMVYEAQINATLEPWVDLTLSAEQDARVLEMEYE